MTVSLKDLAMAEKSRVGNDQEIPDVSVPLPSRGKVYSAENVLFMADTIDVRAMTAKDENILSSQALLKKGTALSQLMRACITNKLVDPDSLLVGDKNAVLIAIRNSSYGAGYAVDITCPSCDHTFENEFDMSKLPIKTLDVDPVLPNSNVFRHVLPRTKKEVMFKLMTARDMAELDQIESQRKKAGLATEDSMTHAMLHQVISINGEDDRSKLLKIIEALPAYDTRDFRDVVADIVPGVDMTQEMTCPSCDAVQEVMVPLGTEFFWPSARRRKRR